MPYFLDSVSPPEAVTDLSAATNPTIEGEALLSWTAPDGNSPATDMRAAGYFVRMATFSVDSLAGDTTAWWNISSSAPAVAPSPQLPGNLELLTITGLEPGNTFYFAVRSTDSASLISTIDVRAEAAGLPQAFALIPDLKPATPANLALSPGVAQIQVSWNAVNASDLDFYRLYVDSTAPYNFADQFVITVDSTAVSYTHAGLAPGTSYAYYVTAVDKGAAAYPGLALESDPSATVSTITLTTGALPMEPLGIRVSHSSETVSLEWSPTTRFDTGASFADPAAPTASELIGYRILRSSNICAPDFVWVASNTVAITTWTGNTAGDPYFYRVQSYNAIGNSTSTMVLSSLGEQHLFLDNCASKVVISESQADALSRVTNGLGSDIMILGQRRPQDVGGDIMQSVEFKPMLDGVTELSSFHFSSPVRISLHFSASGGDPVPDTSPLGAPSDAQSMKNLGIYWHNGAEFKKMYGKVDPLAQTVSVDSPNLGRYQIRAMARASGAVFDLSNLSSRMISPNNDGLNDVMIFTYDPGPNNVVAEGRIYDLRGGLVATMTPGLVPNTLTWDGKMNGRVVSGGVYVYQLKGDGKTFNGTVVIAR